MPAPLPDPGGHGMPGMMLSESQHQRSIPAPRDRLIFSQKKVSKVELLGYEADAAMTRGRVNHQKDGIARPGRARQVGR